ncbi:PP2C family protein-serine/threonine phosphatase [Trichothermofontia sp.]
MSSSLAEPLLTASGDNLQRVAAVASQSPLVRATAQYLVSQFRNLNQIQTLQPLSFRREGALQWVTITPFVDKRGLDWLIVVVVPQSDFMAQIQANTQRTIALCVLAFVLATGVGPATAHWIATPILRLNRAAQAIADGELEQRVQVRGVRELETLSDSFNRMAEQLRTLFAALAATNAELEQRLADRTFDLQVANQEITHLNEQLAAENQRLGTELDVARRLQRLLLPKEEELQAIAGLQIAGFMEPAAEVGGDYYDVLQYDGKVKIGIGNVTGHGLGSDVLMLMVQTAVRTLLVNQETDPVKFLGTLNRALYDNLQRMQSDKNLTLALLEYQEGHLRLSGQHEELILVRATGEVERIDTIDLGFPLGLEQDITAFVGETAITLHAGDVVVLYTDGITEAMNAQRQQYGPDRLCQVVRNHAQRSAQEIRQAVLEDIWNYVGEEPLRDNLTLLVLKQI